MTKQRAKGPEPDRRLLALDEAKKRLATTSLHVQKLCNSPAWIGKVQSIGADIGDAQRAKTANPSLRNRPVAGDWDFLLESTHQILGRVLQDQLNQSLGTSCKLIIDMLEALCDIEEAHHDLGLPCRIANYFHQYVDDAVSSERCYIFLLYLTYLRIEWRTNPEKMAAVDKLLDQFRLLAILVGFPAGLADCFVAFNGRHRFTEEGSPPFENRYYYDREIKPGDTLTTLIRMYPHWDRTSSERLAALYEANLQLKGADPGAELLNLDPKVTHVKMVPPTHQNAQFQARVDRYSQQLRGGAASPELKVDRQAFVFICRGKSHPMKNGKQFLLLAYLVENQHRFVEIEELAEQVWQDATTTSDTIKTTVYLVNERLRREGILDVKITGEQPGHYRIVPAHR